MDDYLDFFEKNAYNIFTMLVDETIITIKSGKGGDGSTSFRREKYVPKGGPDGGDGGNGGDVIFVCDRAVHTLMDFAAKKNFAAKDGDSGHDNKKHGRNGEDLFLKIPPGTIVSEIIEQDDTKHELLLHDFITEGEEAVMVRGGKGGLGNVHFATATNQAPQYAQKGKPGVEKVLKLELKLIADIGLIGLPNSGKSTLLSRISNARPKIANYPFTTLEPNLGVAKFHEHNIVAADIPGLIEGASRGKGLGDKFLRHIERTHALVHVLDINSLDLVKDYNDIRHELAAWSKTLAEKPEIIVLNKIDTLEKKEAQKLAKEFAKKIGQEVLTISAVSGEGVDELLSKIVKIY